MVVTVEIEGLQEIDAAIADLKKATAKAVLRRALMASARPMVQAMRAAAPRDSGDLADSIAVSSRKPHDHQTGRRAFGQALRGGASRAEAGQAARRVNREQAFAEVFVGPGRHPQAVQQEFGNANHGPQAFARPGWDQTKKQVLDLIAGNAWAEIEKAAKRAARKAARLAARG